MAGRVVPVIPYLSDEWIEAANEAVANSAELKKSAKDQDLTIAYEVTGTPSGKVRYGMTFKDGAASVTTGKHADAGAAFTLDYETATQIARGELSAQAAFMQGRMKLAGDVTVLIGQYRLIDETEDALSELRANTEY